MPRWSTVEQGAALESMARLPYWSACVIVAPPLSAIAHSSGSPRRSRTPSSIGFWAVSAVTARKQVFPVSTFPPSDLTYQSQLPPSTLPPTIEFLTMTAAFVFGGISGTKSDSTTPMAPPLAAELRQIVRWTSRSSPSASWKRPPPATAALLPEMVVFSISESPSAKLMMPPPLPADSSISPSSVKPIRAELFRNREPRMMRSLSGALARPPPMIALFSRTVVSRMRNTPLDVL